jgi:hypothetical protein
MRLFQKNLEDLSSRISAAEAIKNSWQGPNDMAEVGEMLEQLQVLPLYDHKLPQLAATKPASYSGDPQFNSQHRNLLL